MTSLTPGSSPSAGALSSGMERRRAPRIAPLSADIYTQGNRTVPEVSLQDLKARARKPGEASFFYFDHHFQFNAVKVLPGEYFVSGENIVIMTVLGSCIAACLWDSRARVGGMNHFMLPERLYRRVGALWLVCYGTADQRDAQAGCTS